MAAESWMTSYFKLGSDIQLLARNLKALSSRASDIKETVQSRELNYQDERRGKQRLDRGSRKIRE